jgi:acyl-CoA synthetase (NDP forming)
MKIVSPQILHKTEAGGVDGRGQERRGGRAGLRRQSSPMRAVTTRRPSIDGVQVQQMLAGGQEVIIGAVTDPAASANWSPSAWAASWSKC